MSRGTRHEPDPVRRRAGSVRDSQALAPFGIAVGAKILGALEPLVDDLRLEILRRDHRRLEELGRRIEERRFGLRGLAGQEVNGHLRRRSRDDLARLQDRVVLVARDDQLQSRQRRVIAGHWRHRVDAGRLEGRDGRAARAVVGGHDADNLRPRSG